MSSGILLQASRRQTMGLLSIAPVPAQGICLYLEQWSISDVEEEKLSPIHLFEKTLINGIYS